MAVADEIAAQAAKDALAKEMEGKFNYIGEAYTQAQDAARANTQNIIDQLTQKGTDFQDQFNKDARSAYINKMQRGQQLEGELSRLGLGNAGYGVTQRLMNESAYGKNLADLQTALSKNLTSIEQSKATAGTDLGNTLADLAMKQASQQSSIDQYITNLLQDTYNKAYDRSYNERMDQEQLAASYARSYGGYSGDGGKDSDEITTAYYSGKMPSATANAVNAYGTFSNGYQPKGIVGYGTVSKVKDKNGNYKTKVVNSTTLQGTKTQTNQYIWQTADGTQWIWNGMKMKYEKL